MFLLKLSLYSVVVPGLFADAQQPPFSPAFTVLGLGHTVKVTFMNANSVPGPVQHTLNPENSPLRLVASVILFYRRVN